MRPFTYLDENDESFAEGLILTDGRCFISFLRADYTFVYRNEDEMIDMHNNNNKNRIKFYNIQQIGL